MRLPILYAMSWPHRIKVDYGRGIDHKFDLVRTAHLVATAARSVPHHHSPSAPSRRSLAPACGVLTLRRVDLAALRTRLRALR